MRAFAACLTGLLLVCGCTNSSDAITDSPNVQWTAEAGAYMTILKEMGVLAEVPTERHGNLQSAMMCDPKAQAEFPFSTRFRATMIDAPNTTYLFVVTKESEEAPWILSKAQRETDGQSTELPLPSEDEQSKANRELLRRKIQ